MLGEQFTFSNDCNEILSAFFSSLSLNDIIKILVFTSKLLFYPKILSLEKFIILFLRCLLLSSFIL